MKCLVCDGLAKQHVTIHAEGKTSAIDLSCVWCDDGKMSEQQRTAYYRSLATSMWCRCGNNSGRVTFHDDSPAMKHHWTCDECGKVTQVG